MTLQELIDQLSEVAQEFGPDTEVRLASQPSWSFDWTIAGISTLHSQDEELAAPRVVWICEGSQIGYTTDRHWEAL